MLHTLGEMQENSIDSIGWLSELRHTTYIYLPVKNDVLAQRSIIDGFGT